MPYLVQTHQLTKTIGGGDLVSGLNLHLAKGEIYGFLGPNGAGKTSVMKMLTNLWKPSSGTIELFGEPLTPTSYAVLKRMGSIIEFPTFYDRLSACENLQLHCDYMGYARPGCIDEALDLLGISETGKKPVGRFSLGMRQRLGIARAILTRPELLILDEPTNGLDPAGIKHIRDLLRMLCQDYGMSILISSHILSEIESLADTIGIVHHGKMKREITMRDIAGVSPRYLELTVTDVQRAAYVLTDKLNVENLKIIGENKLRIYDLCLSTTDFAKALALNDVGVTAMTEQNETLEDYFLKVTQEDASC